MSFEVHVKSGDKEEVKSLMSSISRLYGDRVDVKLPYNKRIFELRKVYTIPDGQDGDDTRRRAYAEFRQNIEPFLKNLRNKMKEADNDSWVVINGGYGPVRFQGEYRIELLVSLTSRGEQSKSLLSQELNTLVKQYNFEITSDIENDARNNDARTSR